MLKCQVCEKERNKHLLRIVKHPNAKTGVRVECLICAGLTEEMADQVIKTGDAFFAAADKMWEQILV